MLLLFEPLKKFAKLSSAFSMFFVTKHVSVTVKL